MLENRYGGGQRNVSVPDKGREKSTKKITLSLCDLLS
jgi:hypothetical protein